MSNKAGKLQRWGVALAAGAMGAGLLPMTAASAAVETEAFCVNVPDDAVFGDVSSTDSHAANILCLSATGITKGKTAAAYAPGEATSRGQMATFIARFIDKANELALGELTELPSTGPDKFSDDDGSPHEASINRLAAAGIVAGRADGSYGPDETVNRSQMASYIVRAIEFLIGEDLPAGDDAFSDDDDSSHEANIDKLAAAQIVDGKAGGLYAPGDPVTRSQMASYIVRSLSVLHADELIDAVPAPAGTPVEPPAVSMADPIGLDATKFPQGGLVSGTVANPTTIENVSAQGCGLSLGDVTVDGATGTFTFPLPSHISGDCVLAFAAAWTDGSSAHQTFEVEVTAVADEVTDSPDLVATTYSPGTNQVIFQFDEDVTSIVPGGAGRFHVYGINGVALSAVDADIIPANPKTVIATFPNNWGPALGDFATRAGLDKDAVEDAEGNLNYPDFAELMNQKPGITVAPDLLSVDNIRTDAPGLIVADFTFDQAVNQASIQVGQFYVAEKSTTPVPAGGVAPGLFRGTAAVDWSDDSRTVTVQFGTTAAAPTPNTSEIVRGIVEAGAVQGVAVPQAFNTLQVEGACVDGAPGACTLVTEADGTANGKTDTPDIVSAVPGGNSSLRVTFDEPVSADGLAAASFVAYDADLTSTVGTFALRSSTDTKVLDVDFPAGTLTNAVILTLEDGSNTNSGGPGVNGTTGAQLPNIDDEVAIGAPPAGTTALADLLGVTATQKPNGGWVVEFKFDSAPGPHDSAAGPGQFYLVDPEGTLTPNTGGWILGNSVFLTTDATTATAVGINTGAVGIDVSDIADSILGAVDEVHPGSNPTFTEGEAPLVKTPLP